ncbi:MAG: TrkA C-terminal domain-containing protein, partial [Betaproteobacteria bacterium]
LQPGMFYAFFQRAGAPFRVQHLLADPTNPGARMHVTPAMLERAGETLLLPSDDTLLKPGDRILFMGNDVARRLQQRYLIEPGTVAWVCSGSEPARGFLFRWWEQRQRAQAND